MTQNCHKHARRAVHSGQVGKVIQSSGAQAWLVPIMAGDETSWSWINDIVHGRCYMFHAEACEHSSWLEGSVLS